MDPILLIGEGKLCHSVAACLAISGHAVSLVTGNVEAAQDGVDEHLTNSEPLLHEAAARGTVEYNPANAGLFNLIVIVTPDDITLKRDALALAQKHLSPGGIVAVNTLSVDLNELQQGQPFATQVVGLNWVEPAHTTLFLEIIGNSATNPDGVTRLKELGLKWGKDPYVLQSGFSVKARLAAALTREALFLVSNGYATHEDIDRNCRNDAGYYLPFVGNARYMDLMGTYAYGMVMKDLNRHLSKDETLDDDTALLLENGHLGMEKGKGFFEYPDGEADEWKEKMAKFSYEINEIIRKYPFEGEK